MRPTKEQMRLHQIEAEQRLGEIFITAIVAFFIFGAIVGFVVGFLIS